jgi:AAA+ superfamily predicted ATPase
LDSVGAEIRYRLAAAHFDLWLAAVTRGLRGFAALDSADENAGAERQLQRIERTLAGAVPEEPWVRFDDQDHAVEEALRSMAADFGTTLPIDELVARTGIARSDTAAIAVVAASEFDADVALLCGSYGAPGGAPGPTVDLVVRLTSGRLEHHLRRASLGQYAPLRLASVLHTADSSGATSTETVRLGGGVLDFLLGVPVDLASIVEVTCDDDPSVFVRPTIGRWATPRLAAALDAGLVEVLGLWAEHEADLLDAARSIAASRRQRLSVIRLRDDGSSAGTLREGLARAAVAERLALVLIDALSSDQRDRLASDVAAVLLGGSQRLLIGGKTRWRPRGILQTRRYLECDVASLSYTQRHDLWQALLPDDTVSAASMAARFQLTSGEIAAAADLAEVARLVANDGGSASLDVACSTVLRSASETTLRMPRESARLDRLVLPDATYQQVVEVAGAAARIGFVSDTWGFEAHGGPVGYKALFLGEPGTGKTMAAEVIAGTLGVPLMVVDLAQTVSKWVGETSKNLDAVFDEADRSNAVLFFDEADSLFGKRGEVRHGSDRYANTEVSHLLVRFERHRGLVILASNLRENIDGAFVRRFHSVVHFPRPDLAARRRLWQQAFPTETPLAPDVDLALLAQLEMTGAAIINSARRAALAAAMRDSDSVGHDDIVDAVQRQFQSESRVIKFDELRPAAEISVEPVVSGGVKRW